MAEALALGTQGSRHHAVELDQPAVRPAALRLGDVDWTGGKGLLGALGAALVAAIVPAIVPVTARQALCPRLAGWPSMRCGAGRGLCRGPRPAPPRPRPN